MSETNTSSLIIQSSVYGDIQVNREQIYHFPKTIVGISDYKEYALIQMEETPFFILHALHDDFHFILIPAEEVFRDYEFDLSPNIVDLLQIEKPQDVIPFLIVNMIEDELFVNLKAPVLIAPVRKKGCQHIVTEKEYPIRQKIFGKETP